MELRELTGAEVAAWLAADGEIYLRERITAGEPEDVARQAADRQHATYFPDGRPAAGHQLLAIEQDGHRIGMIWVGPTPRRPDDRSSAWLFNLEVDEAWRGRGIARAALVAVEEQLARAGVTEFGLNVFGDNSAARRLYSRAGYREAAVTMTKRLGSTSP